MRPTKDKILLYCPDNFQMLCDQVSDNVPLFYINTVCGLINKSDIHK